MAVTPAPKGRLIDGKYVEHDLPAPQQQFLEANGKKDGRDRARLAEAIKMASAMSISWRKAFLKILESEK